MEFKQVKSFGFSKIANAYHVAFFSTFRAIINEHGAERLNLPGEIVDEFSDLLDDEQIVVNRSRASINNKARLSALPALFILANKKIRYHIRA